MLVGGYTIVPIVGRNGEKISIGTASQNIKLGTFAKLKRGIALQKSIKLQDVIISTQAFGVVTIDYATIELTGGGEASVIILYLPLANGTYSPRILHVTSDDTIYYTSN